MAVLSAMVPSVCAQASLSLLEQLSSVLALSHTHFSPTFCIVTCSMMTSAQPKCKKGWNAKAKEKVKRPKQDCKGREGNGAKYITKDRREREGQDLPRGLEGRQLSQLFNLSRH